MSLTSYQTAPPRDLENGIINAITRNAMVNSLEKIVVKNS
jgi:hypothetical protein